MSIVVSEKQANRIKRNIFKCSPQASYFVRKMTFRVFRKGTAIFISLFQLPTYMIQTRVKVDTAGYKNCIQTNTNIPCRGNNPFSTKILPKKNGNMNKLTLFIKCHGLYWFSALSSTCSLMCQYCHTFVSWYYHKLWFTKYIPSLVNELWPFSDKTLSCNIIKIQLSVSENKEQISRKCHARANNFFRT